MPEDLASQLGPQPEIVKDPSVQTEIFLISSESEARVCPFWVGLYRTGTMEPKQLLELRKTGDILTTAVNEGVACTDPLVLAETKDNGQASLVFLAPIENEKLVDSHLWVDKLCDAICAWSPKTPGFYFAPELLGADIASKLLIKILKTLILKNQFPTFYLYIGSHGLHNILNAALKLRSRMLEESTRDVVVFH